VSGQAPDAVAPDSAGVAEAPAAEAATVAAIEQAINDTRAARHTCWARGAVDDYRLAGRITLRVQFGADGPPVVTVRDDQPQDVRLTYCLVDLYRGHAWPDVFAPGTVVELPFAFEAPRYQYTIQAEHVPWLVLKGEPPADGSDPIPGDPSPWRVLLDAANTGNDDIAVVLVELRAASERAGTPPQSAPVAHERTTMLFYVIDGQAEIVSAAGQRAGQLVRAGQAIWVPPGTTYAVRPTDALLTAVQIFVPAGPELALRGEAPADTAPARGRRGARLPRVQAAPQIYPIAGGQAEVGLYFDRASGHEAASLATLTARPGMRIPAHVHERETEMVLVLAGTGTMTIDGDTYPIAPMTAIQIPPGTEHAVEVSGPEPLRALQVYTPSGPEQRFKQPAGSRPGEPAP
jgi:mannose-6-phosphate isomerase-like protein (cupin superfamily)